MTAMYIYADMDDLSNKLWNARDLKVADGKFVDHGKRKGVTSGNFCLAQSQRHGLGVFALKRLKQHAILFNYGGKVSNTPLDNGNDLEVEVRDGKKWYLVSDTKTHFGHYVNGDVVPNAGYYWCRKGDEYQVAIVTVRPVKAGDEITCGYLEDLWGWTCRQRMSKVLATLCPPPQPFEPHGGIILCRYGKKKKFFYNLKWTPTPKDTDICWAVASSGPMSEVEYIWKKQNLLYASQWLVRVPPAEVKRNKRDKARVVVYDGALVQPPKPSHVMLCKAIAECGAGKHALWGAAPYFCDGDPEICACEAKSQREADQKVPVLSFESDSGDDVVEIDPPKRGRSRSRSPSPTRSRSLSPEIHGTFKAEIQAKAQAAVEAGRQKMLRSFDKLVHVDINAIFDGIKASVDAI